MAFLSVQTLAFIFGISGNIVSFMVFLAPMPTFYTIYKRKSSEGFQALPYSVALLSASLLLYYAFLKSDTYIISINGIGCLIELIYLLIYIIYSPKKTKISTSGMILLFNVGGLGVIMAVTLLVVKGSSRLTLVGWVCAVINLAVFASPLNIMRQVIRTKSVEFMPFALSFFLTICSKMWFFYGFFIRDYYIALPNVMGFLFGIAQMTLYFIYKDAKKDVDLNFTLEGLRIF
ncbi:bidirectional sugar transporter NEC1-like [Olea europaea subsp. europaea]|uniref:Bidirectional sugar transporter SWEET n=1 Tax=Olea europaea subsp. europaea TaxID=158383 RepID=A0A8S0SPC5_OLEEU|nr:bidirectional sugar transporter NEC1-like [Olea europaea subsp. europaea]